MSKLDKQEDNAEKGHQSILVKKETAAKEATLSLRQHNFRQRRF